MALQTSGSISLLNIQGEFGGTNPISISEYYRNGGFVTSNNNNVPTTGQISFNQFYGAVKQFAFTITSNQTNANLRSLAFSAGWNGIDPLVATISSGVYISSTSVTIPALTIDGAFPSGVVLNNNGIIVGMGGAGGNGAGVFGVSTPIEGSAGQNGGTALSAHVAVSISNVGILAGGGGGGGGGQAGNAGSGNAPSGSGGGGGRSSLAASSVGGSGGASNVGMAGGSGSNGTISSGGIGGSVFNSAGIIGGVGGTGGDWGSPGAAGGLSANPPLAGPYAGGAAGAAVSGNAYITWLATGTRLGPVT